MFSISEWAKNWQIHKSLAKINATKTTYRREMILGVFTTFDQHFDETSDERAACKAREARAKPSALGAAVYRSPHALDAMRLLKATFDAVTPVSIMRFWFPASCTPVDLQAKIMDRLEAVAVGVPVKLRRCSARQAASGRMAVQRAKPVVQITLYRGPFEKHSTLLYSGWMRIPAHILYLLQLVWRLRRGDKTIFYFSRTSCQRAPEPTSPRRQPVYDDARWGRSFPAHSMK